MLTVPPPTRRRSIVHILVLTPEYPPNVVGGLGQHVAELTRALAAAGTQVTVLTALGSHDNGEEREVGGLLAVRRVRDHAPGPLSFSEEVVQRNVAMLEAVLSSVAQGQRFDVVHAHDWLTAHAARAVKHALKIPLIATIHATEYGRHGGLFNDLQRHISDIEWWLAYEAWRVIACSRSMHAELQRIFQVPRDKIDVIPNGVSLKPSDAERAEIQAVRRHYANDHERLVFFVGRLVFEKGVDILLRALPHVLASHPHTIVVIAGRGPERDALAALAHDLGVASRVRFAGYISDEERNTLYQAADVAVFPSRYEPFGIVALEAMALGAPLVASGSGGLAEVVEHRQTGLLFHPGDPRSLAEQLIAALDSPSLCRAMSHRALQVVTERYSWRRIAQQTLEVYRSVLEAAKPGDNEVRDSSALPVGSPRVYA